MYINFCVYSWVCVCENSWFPLRINKTPFLPLNPLPNQQNSNRKPSVRKYVHGPLCVCGSKTLIKTWWYIFYVRSIVICSRCLRFYWWRSICPKMNLVANILYYILHYKKKIFTFMLSMYVFIYFFKIRNKNIKIVVFVLFKYLK